MTEQDLLEQLHGYGSIFERAVAATADADTTVSTLDDRPTMTPRRRRRTWLVGCAAAAAVLFVLGLVAFARNDRSIDSVAADRGGARPCLPADFGWASAGVLPPGVTGTVATTPPLSYSSLQHRLIEALPCAFTGLEVLNGDPMSVAVHVAPLTKVENAAIARVAGAFPNYRLFGAEARQSLAEADAQMAAISAAVHRNSTVEMGLDGQVTVNVYGVPEDEISAVKAEIIAASQALPADKNAVPPIVNVTSDPSGLSQSMGTVTGTLREVGGPPPGPDMGVTGSVEVRQAGSTRTHRVEVSSDGRFQLDLPAGSYTLIGHSPLYGDNTYVCRPSSSDPIAVRAGSTTEADVLCQIR